MKRFKKLVSVLTLTAMLAASLTACGGKDPVAEDDSTAGTTTADSSTATTETSGDSTFTYAISGDPTETVNVITTSDRWGLSTVKMIYSPLYMNNADGINWFLATDYSVSDDNLTYTFKLRDDVKWSDGEPFTADDVVFCTGRSGLSSRRRSGVLSLSLSVLEDRCQAASLRCSPSRIYH